MAQFTEEELQIYKAKIRRMPVPKLRDELLDVINDPTPDRPNIVKTRIRILENREKRYNNVKRKIAAKQKQPLPDKDGFKHFLFIIAATFAYILIEILFSRDGFSLITKFNLGRFFGTVKYFPTIGIFGWYTYYIPFFRKNVWDEKKQFFKDIPEFWLRNFKIALSFASFLFFFSLEIFSTKTYNGVFYSGNGLPAYIIATGYLISSTLYIINVFFPIIKKFRPNYGITLIAFAAALEQIISKIFN
jgi:hypothetical protein